MSAAPDPDGSVPVGPGPTRDEPDFSEDPRAWCAWMDELIASDPARVRDVRPAASWVDDAGHHWRVVGTPEGPEIRPGLENPFLVHGPLPRITAILVTDQSLSVELTLRDFREVHDVPLGVVRLEDLGTAMLTGTELPHHAVERVGDETWSLAARRWGGSTTGSSANARGGSGQLPNNAPAAGIDTQNRPARPLVRS
jgi:hypothetical protein